MAGKIRTATTSFMLLAGAIALGFSACVAGTTGGEKGRTAFNSRCGRCHPLSLPIGADHDRKGWEDVVSRMSHYSRNIDREIPAEEQGLIVDFLLANAGK